MKLKTKFVFLCWGLLSLITETGFSQTVYVDELSYGSQSRNTVPIPPSEQMLQTVVAETWFEVTKENHSLEGAIFDSDGNLLFCDVTERCVLRLTPDKQLSVVVRFETLSPGGLAFHKDGRLFIAAIDMDRKEGGIFVLNKDSSGMQPIINTEAGYMPNDLVFDAAGGFYFTDFRGTLTELNGGVYYVSPDFSSVTSVLPRLSMANGIALSPDGRTLWVTEFARNLLHKVTLKTATAFSPVGTTVAYHFIGPAPDSMRSDTDGNVYVAIYGQGRVLVFSPHGIPVGQVLLPGREKGHNLLSTSLALYPGTTDLYAVTSDGERGMGAGIFHARVFGKGLSPF